MKTDPTPAPVLNGRIYVSWQAMLGSVVGTLVSLLAAMLAVQTYLMSLHASTPHIGSATDRDLLNLVERIDRLDRRLEINFKTLGEKLDEKQGKVVEGNK